MPEPLKVRVRQPLSVLIVEIMQHILAFNGRYPPRIAIAYGCPMIHI